MLTKRHKEWAPEMLTNHLRSFVSNSCVSASSSCLRLRE